mmetsp:Transcript_26162/g.60391  ORF Transcript_26162/g.60391 Transcript_26162/m.60391 type:complete len:225 (-) Transcript_26162:191-865(-)
MRLVLPGLGAAARGARRTRRSRDDHPSVHAGVPRPVHASVRRRGDPARAAREDSAARQDAPLQLRDHHGPPRAGADAPAAGARHHGHPRPLRRRRADIKRRGIRSIRARAARVCHARRHPAGKVGAAGAGVRGVDGRCGYGVCTLTPGPVPDAVVGLRARLACLRHKTLRELRPQVAVRQWGVFGAADLPLPLPRVAPLGPFCPVGAQERSVAIAHGAHGYDGC